MANGGCVFLVVLLIIVAAVGYFLWAMQLENVNKIKQKMIKTTKTNFQNCGPTNLCCSPNASDKDLDAAAKCYVDKVIQTVGLLRAIEVILEGKLDNRITEDMVIDCLKECGYTGP